MTQTASAQPSGSIKDTIESILVAFMLAFIFRAFIVEAFVIPTGSMAPTLMGAHTRFRCPDCGYRFEVNYSGRDNGGDDIEIPAYVGAGRSVPAVCPNCGYVLPPSNSGDPAGNPTNAPVHYGDRILVLKYLYLFQDPKRWDVVVFKAPFDPAHNDYQQNYIKRLTGKPGESIMILDGDIYVGQNDDLSSFKVQTKPPYAQDALWRVVYDNDYYPAGLARKDYRDADAPPFVQPWKIAGPKAWTLGDGLAGHRDIQFKDLDGSSSIQFDPAANPMTFAFTDSLAYDMDEARMRGGTGGLNNVSDIKLSLFYQRHEGDGPLTLSLSKQDHHFDAIVNSDSVQLVMDGQPLGAAVAVEKTSRPVKLDFQNVDYRVSLSLDGHEVLASTPEQYAPDVPMLMDAYKLNRTLKKPTVRITAANQNSTLSHVNLWRDVYYLNRSPDQRIVSATPEDFPNHVAKLGKDEFFVCGDNSAVSLDARYWTDPIDLDAEDLHVKAGVVPRRFMLGKAFFVYWPAGFRPFPAAPPLGPNFGDMRFIH